MQFSIIVPTFKNHKYLKTSINSIKKNSKFIHEIIVHINGDDIETERYLCDADIKYTKTQVMQSYKSIMKKIHPDVSPELTRLASIVNEAKEIVIKNIS